MLAAIREKTTGITAAVIVGLLIIPFAFWGINSYFEGGSALLVAKGGGIVVSQRVYQNTLNRYRNQVEPEELDSQSYKARVLNGLIAESLLASQAQQNGYRVSNEVLNLFIKQLPNFQRDNKFDPEIYKTTLGAQRMATTEFEAQLRESLITEQIAGIYSESALVTQADLSQIMALITQQRQFAYALITPEMFLNKIKVTEDAISSFYKTNIAQFQKPEAVRIEFIELSAKALVGDYQPTEAELRELYKSEAGTNVEQPEKRRVSHILVEIDPVAAAEDQEKALKKIQDLALQLKAGADFAQLAKKASDDPGSAENGGDLGYLEPGAMVSEFESAAYALKKNQVSEPVKTQFGYHLIKLTDYRASVKAPYSKLKEKLKQQAIQQKGEERFYDLSETFSNLTYENPDSLLPAAEELKIPVKESQWFPRTGGQGIASNQKLVEATFNPEVLEQGKNSDVIEIDDTTLIVLRVKEHQKSEPIALAKVKDVVEKDLKRRQALELVLQLRDDMLQALKDGDSIKNQVQKHGLTLVEPKPLMRTQTQGIDTRIVNAVFKAERPKQNNPVSGSADLGDSGYALFLLKQVKEGDPSKIDPKMREQLVKIVNAHRGSGYFQFYNKGLRQNADIRIFTDNL